MVCSGPVGTATPRPGRRTFLPAPASNGVSPIGSVRCSDGAATARRTHVAERAPSRRHFGDLEERMTGIAEAGMRAVSSDQGIGAHAV